MSKIDIQPAETFDYYKHGNAVAAKWQEWLDEFEIYVNALDITKNGQKRNLLLHCAGKDIQRIVKDHIADSGTTMEHLSAAITLHIGDTVNLTFERYEFFTCDQKEEEPIDGWFARLKLKARTCKFEDLEDSLLRDRLVASCQSSSLRRKLLKIKNVPLQDALQLGRAEEAASKQAAKMEESTAKKQDGAVAAVRSKRKEPEWAKKAREQRKERDGAKEAGGSRQPDKCRNCGAMGHQRCSRARDKPCNNCGILGHFERACLKAKKVNSMDQEDTEDDGSYQEKSNGQRDDDYPIWSVKISQCGKSDAFGFSKEAPPIYPIDINGRKEGALIDSGADMSIISEHTRKRLNIPGKAIRPTSVRLLPYGTTKALPLTGSVVLSVKYGSVQTRERFAVVEGSHPTLLGRACSQRINLLRIGPAKRIHQVAKEISTDKRIQQILDRYPKVFEGLGCVKGIQVSIEVKEDTVPVVHPPSRVPVHLLEATNKELDLQEKLGIIEPVEGPTPWCSRMVVAPKQAEGEVRLTQDFRDVNRAVVRERQQMPRLQDITAHMAGAKYFSRLDMLKAFHQIELHPNSRQFATFSTPRGTRQFTRLVMGFCNSSEILQRVMQMVLGGLPGVQWSQDDITVFGASEDDHDKNLEQCLKRLQDYKVTLNRKKCVFRCTETEFLGVQMSKCGISASSKKLEAVQNFRPPQNPSEVRSFLGFLQFLAPFIQNLADLSAPLRLLTQKRVLWTWGKPQQDAFHKLQTAASKTQTLAYFDTTKPTHLYVDASPAGLGAILAQKQKNGRIQPVAYASRSLKDTETRYSQIEKECLAICFGCEKFSFYLIGDPHFTVITDHRPLVPLFNKPGAKLPSARIERWVLGLQHLHFWVEYSPGAGNAADILSRQPMSCPPSEDTTAEANLSVSSVLINALPRAMNLGDFRLATENDPMLQRVLTAMHQKAPVTRQTSESLGEFGKILNELYEFNGILLRGDRIVVPDFLKEKVLALAHTGHQGITRTKQRLREKVWWPGMATAVESLIERCDACNLSNSGGATPRPPLSPTPKPQGPWTKVAMDFKGPLPNGKHLMVLIDYDTKFPEVEIVNTITAEAIVPRLRQIFSRFGCPYEMVTDNGPTFRSQEFNALLKNYGVRHRFTTPYWPQANGEVERLNRSLTKVLRAARYSRQNIAVALDEWLFAYRQTPHPATGKAPAEMLFRKNPGDNIPTKERLFDKWNGRVSEFAEKMKRYYDTTHKVKPHSLQKGDLVLLKDVSGKEWRKDPMKVISVQGNTATLESKDGGIYKRHVTWMKHLKSA